MGGKRSAFNSIADIDWLYNLSDTAFAILGDDSDYVDKIISWMRDREELDQHCNSITTHNLSLDVGLSIVSLGFGILIGLIVVHERFRDNRLYSKSDDFFLQQLINLKEDDKALQNLLTEEKEKEQANQLKEYLEYHGDHHRIFKRWWRSEFNPRKAQQARQYKNLRNNAIEKLLKEQFPYKVIFRATRPDQNGDRNLSEQGRQDITRVANYLAYRHCHVSHVMHSEKCRTRQTAEILGQKIASGIEIEETPLLSPDADIAPLVDEVSHWSDSTLLVGHMPFVSFFISELVAGKDTLELVHFSPGTMVCLERLEGQRWIIDWILRPDLVSDNFSASL